MIRSLLVFLGGALLIVPGFVTDVFGLVLLIPFTRNLIARFALARIRAAIERGTVRVTATTVGGSSYPRTRPPHAAPSST